MSLIGRKISRYTIAEQLGAGGMGEVYLAHDADLGRSVAIKLIQSAADDEITRRRFFREARAVAALNHPNIITIYEVGKHEGVPFIAMEYVEGASLGERLRSGDISAGEAVDIVAQVLDGLEHAHGAGVVHRDIKPDNILIGADGRARLLDFGLAKVRDTSRLTSDGTAVGTLAYMSPEQVRGEEVDARSDLFSVGTVLYHLIAARPPFDADHAAAIVYSIANEDPPPLERYSREVNPELERIVGKALAKDASERYQSAADMRADLKRQAKDRKAPPPVPATPTSRRWWIAGAAVVAVAIVVALLGPWRLSVTSQDSAAAADKLAVMYFENMADPTDPERYGELIPALLLTSLSDSEATPIVSYQRLYDILKNMGHEGEKRIDRDTATEVATRAGARWMLTGSVLRQDPLLVSSQVIDVASGDVIVTRQLEAAPGETVFEIVDRLADALEADMAFELDDTESRPIVDMTSANTEALRHLLDAVEYMNRYEGVKMKAALEAAIAADSTFVAPYLYFTHPSVPATRQEKMRVHALGQRFVHRADRRTRFFMNVLQLSFDGEYADAMTKLSAYVEMFPEDKLGLMIFALFSRVVAEDYRSAERALLQVLELDPSDAYTVNQLVYVYDLLGNHDRAIWAINRYIELAPDEANPRDTRGDLLARNGRLEEAIDSYREALAIDPGFFASMMKVGLMFTYSQEWDSAAVWFDRGIRGGTAFYRSQARTHRVSLHVYRGWFQQSLSSIDVALGADEADGQMGQSYGMKWEMKGSVQSALGDPEAALQSFDRGRPRTTSGRLAARVRSEGIRIRALLDAGRDEDARRIVAAAIARADTSDATTLRFRDALRGRYALETGNYEAAADLLEKATPLRAYFPGRYQLALANLRAGRNARAVELFQDLLRGYTEQRFYNPIEAALLHYHAGLAFEASGWSDRAIEQYETLLFIWEDCDPGIPEKADAEARIARLNAGS